MKGLTLTATFTFSSDILSGFLQCPQLEKIYSLPTSLCHFVSKALAGIVAAIL